jgi:hypothetical protein
MPNVLDGMGEKLRDALSQCPPVLPSRGRGHPRVYWGFQYVLLPDGQLKEWQTTAYRLFKNWEGDRIVTHQATPGIARVQMHIGGGSGWDEVQQRPPSLLVDFGTPLTKAQINTLRFQVPERPASGLTTHIRPVLPVFDYGRRSTKLDSPHTFERPLQSSLRAQLRLLLNQQNQRMQQYIRWATMTGEAAAECLDTLAEDLSPQIGEDIDVCCNPRSSPEKLRAIFDRAPQHPRLVRGQPVSDWLPALDEQGGRTPVLILLASHPNTPPECLERLAIYHPVAVARNPTAPLLLLESPGWGNPSNPGKGIIHHPLSRWADWVHLPEDYRSFYARLE